VFGDRNLNANRGLRTLAVGLVVLLTLGLYLLARFADAAVESGVGGAARGLALR
jgi:hypothetical protein